MGSTPEIPYAQNSLRFEIGGAFNPNEVKEYAYRLSPMESDFSAWSQSNKKEYTNLKEGDYTLIVRMRSETSDEIKENAFNLEILPIFSTFIMVGLSNDYTEDSIVLKELGRLREISFRKSWRGCK